MPYSMDAQENKENPFSPSYLSMQEQLLYKLAALDASVQSGFRRMDEKMDRFQNDLHEAQIVTNDRINQLDKETQEKFAFKRQRIDALEKRLVQEVHNGDERYHERVKIMDEKIAEIKNWQTVAKAQVALIIVFVSALWVVFAPTLRHLFGIPN